MTLFELPSWLATAEAFLLTPILKTIAELTVVAIVILHMIHISKAVRTQRRESKALSDKLATVVDKVNEVNRAELLQILSQTAQEAKRSIVHYTYTFHIPEEEPEMGPLLDAVAGSSIPKSNIRFLGPDYTDNLNRLYSRKRTGAQVRVSHSIRNSDLRFQVVDGRRVVITIGAASEKSKHGYLVESLFLGQILTKWFDQEWEQSLEYDEHVKGLILVTLKIPEIAHLDDVKRIEYISARLGLDADEVRRLLPSSSGLKVTRPQAA